jgi:CBS domain-containing protein
VKTASIAYRVADFLSRHPPFQYLDDTELLELVSGGRVIFHEDGELVFERGRKRKPYVYVIQKGVVRLVEYVEDAEGEVEEVLRDVRGEGDLLGVGRYLGIVEHTYTARTETEVILYALPADLFWEQIKRHPRASHFLAAYFTVAIAPAGLDGDPSRCDELRLGRRPVDWMAKQVEQPSTVTICRDQTPVRDVARMLSDQCPGAAAAIVDAEGAVVGLITTRQLSDRVASGELALEAPAERLMAPVTDVMPPGLPAGAYLTRMLELQSEHIVMTERGRRSGQVVGVLARRDLTRIEAAAPLAIVEDMARATGIYELSKLLTQGQAFIAGGLTDADALRWLAPMATALYAAVLRRIVVLVEGALVSEGHAVPDIEHCWVFFGSAGRGELTTLYDLDHGLIYAEPEADQRRPVRGYFLELGRRVSAALAACGFVSTAKGIVSGHPSACRSINEWQIAFSQWIREPIESGVYRATSFFDVRPVYGDCALVNRLEQHIQAEKARNAGFVPLLVVDSMANLPPLTFFRGLVIDDEGQYTETLDLQRATLQPVVDLARALALDSGCNTCVSTLERLQQLAPEDEVAADLIDETVAAFRNALFYRTRAGLSAHSDGSQVEPSKLTRLEQNLLKSGFRTVLRLMEYMGKRYGVAPRR